MGKISFKGKYHMSARARIFLLCAYDFLTASASFFIALAVRFNLQIGAIPEHYLQSCLLAILAHGLVTCIVYGLTGLYKSVWRYASYVEVYKTLVSVAISSAIHWIIATAVSLAVYGIRMPLSYYLAGPIIQTIFTVAVRFSYRFIRLLRARRETEKYGEKVLIYGAGEAGYTICRAICMQKDNPVHVVGFIDDDPKKKGLHIENYTIFGTGEDLEAVTKEQEVERVVLAIPSLPKKRLKQIIALCNELNLRVSILPGTSEMVNNGSNLYALRDLQVEELVGRETVSIAPEELFSVIQNKSILITGGTASIGRALCYQIAAYNPKLLTVVDMVESRCYELQQELADKFPQVKTRVVLGHINDAFRLKQLIRETQPDMVFHAAIMKNPTLLEENPEEAVKSNIIGTYKTAYAAALCGVPKFIFLSSDAATNPDNVLGYSERIAEMTIQEMNRLIQSGKAHALTEFYPHYSAGDGKIPDDCRTQLTTVRFVHSMGTKGTEVGTIRRQIAEGGPVTVSHPDTIRYFADQDDVAKLILQATGYMRGGEKFVLDIGQPVKVDRLARNMISQAGLRVGQDIEIFYRGLRAGEKIIEEKILSRRELKETANERIYVNEVHDVEDPEFFRHLSEVTEAAYNCDRNLIAMLQTIAGKHEEAIRETFADVQNIVRSFRIEGNLTKVVPVMRGYINRTYIIETLSGKGEIYHYILQRINTNVFRDPVGLMDNFETVTEHLSKTLRLEGAERRNMQETSVPLICKTNDGKNLIQIESGAWRIITCFPDVYGMNMVTDPTTFYQAGIAFGSFLNAVSDLDASKLNITIPNFHNCPSRYRDLLSSIEKDPCGAVKDVEEEIRFIREREEKIGCIHRALESGEIPTRVTHNDTNLNNVLFDNESHLPVAIIDLDTVMPSSPLYDFGDSMRIGTSTAKDDEKDLSKVVFKVELYEYYARGFLEAMGKRLTKEELELLPSASIVMTMEDGIRFLADHIDGDTYYRVDYRGQNLDRCRTQLKLASEMEKALPEIKKTLQKLYDELGLNAKADSGKGW